MSMNMPDFRVTLHTIGSRITPARMSLLKVLWGASMPLTVSEIQNKLQGVSDTVTLYRSLELFVKSGIVRKVDLQHGHAHYELVVGKKHHHHLVCQGCGTVEDITTCVPTSLEKGVLKKSKSFRSIISHSMEFFGMCRRCQTV